MKTLKVLLILMILCIFNVPALPQELILPFRIFMISEYENGILTEARFEEKLTQEGTFSCLIALPQGCDSVNVDVRKIGFGKSYIFSGFLSKQFVKAAKIMSIRGYRVLKLDFDPFFNFFSDKRHITSLLVKVDFIMKKENPDDRRLFSGLWENLVKSLVINPDGVPSFQPVLPEKEEDGAEYLIIAPDGFLPTLEPLKTFRLRQGITTLLVGTSVTGTTTSSIQNYINEAYNTWTVPPGSILLAADHPLIPAPTWNSYCSSDNEYADINEDDLPDVFISRIPVSTLSSLENIVQRIINYEQNPVVDPQYYLHPLACTGFENPSISSWMVTEILNGWYEQKMSKMPERQYTGTNPAPAEWPNPELYALFGPNGLAYLPENPGYLSNYVGGTAAGINQALNQGAMTFFSFSNGNTTSFASPPYIISDLAGLVNASPTLFIDMNSMNGNFTNSNSDCLIEAFIKNINGPVGIIAPTGTMYSSGSEWFTIGVADGLWDDFYPQNSNLFQTGFSVPCQANVYAKYFLHLNSFPINPQVKLTFYHLFHYFGEPYTSLHDTIPSVIMVNHPDRFLAGQEVFEMSADSGSTVALVMNHQLFCVQKSDGNPMLLPLIFAQPGDTLHITVTKKNHFRYYSYVLCHPGVGINLPQSGFSFSIFPNPTNGFVKINFSENLRDGKIELLSVTGNTVFSSDFHQHSTFNIPVSELKKGIYFVKITGGEKGSIIKKVVIQ